MSNFWTIQLTESELVFGFSGTQNSALEALRNALYKFKTNLLTYL